MKELIFIILTEYAMLNATVFAIIFAIAGWWSNDHCGPIVRALIAIFSAIVVVNFFFTLTLLLETFEVGPFYEHGIELKEGVLL